ncbi:MAG: HNH endonuclease [Dehalococcoidia bacterium]
MEELQTIIDQLIDYLMPELTPYEASMYLYLLRNSVFKNHSAEIRVGKRTIAAGFGKGSRGEITSYAHVTEILGHLEQKQCIKIGDTNREGTLYTINLPSEIPLAMEKMSNVHPEPSGDDYFINADKRREIFERDRWICQYCGDQVKQDNATLDHFIPQSKGGDNGKDNLRTCCLMCNSVKSGKTLEDASPLILKSIRERKTRAGN